MNYYQQKIIEIKNLIKAKKFNQAYKILKQEISAPYIPEDIDQIFSNLFKEVNHELYLETTHKKNFSLINPQIVKEILNKDDKANLECHILYNLKDVNLNLILDDIQKFLINPKKDNILKTVLLEAMHAQNIDKEFSLVKNKKEFHLNPKNILPIFLTEQFIQATKLINEVIGISWINILKMNLVVLEWYLYYYYPILPNLKVTKELVGAICFYCFKLNSQEITISKISEMYFNADQTEIKKIIREIESIWEE